MAIAAVVLTVELLQFQIQSTRSIKIFESLGKAAPAHGLSVHRTSRYQGGADLLVLWGPGAPDRFEPLRRQVANGGHVIALDLAYWDRDHKFRVSFDAPHPQAWVMKRPMPLTRLLADAVPILNTWNPDGPVIVAGIGEKAGVQYGSTAVREWESSVISQVKAAGRPVFYRPKKQGPVPGVPQAKAGPIDGALAGASCVVTWHSNVAVDAIRLGIPAVCRDGAAAAVCPSTWRQDLAPLDAGTRSQFLSNLAFFQWLPTEASQCWAFVRETLA